MAELYTYSVFAVNCTELIMSVSCIHVDAVFIISLQQPLTPVKGAFSFLSLTTVGESSDEDVEVSSTFANIDSAVYRLTFLVTDLI